jgi:hypothetical protein
MSKHEFDDPDVEERWCFEQQRVVAEYLRAQNVKHGRIGDWPAWHVAPVASIWAIESLIRPGSIGWWVICGDLPTDYISAAALKPPQHPRKAMRTFAQNWLDVVEAWKLGKVIKKTQIGDLESNQKLEPMIESRALLLMKWADNDSLWKEP